MSTTGRLAPSCTWLPDAALASLFGAVEAAWFVLWVRAVVNTSPDYQVTLPWPMAATVVLAGVMVSALARAWRAPWWLRLPASAVAAASGGALAGAAMVAVVRTGAAGEGLPAAGETAVAGELTALAWAVTAVAWLRGLWLGRAGVTTEHARRSVGIGLVAFLALFAAQAGIDHAAFSGDRVRSLILFLVFVCGALIGLGLVRERSVADELLAPAGQGRAAAWVPVTCLLAGGLAGAGLLVALILLPPARALEQAVLRPVVSALTEGGRTVGEFVPEPGSGPDPVMPDSSPPRPESAPEPPPGGLPGSVWTALAALSLILVPLVWVLRRGGPGRSGWGRIRVRGAGRQAGSTGEVSASPLSWRRLLGALGDLLRRFFGGGGPDTGLPGEAGPPTPGDAPCPPLLPVRAQYRDVLVAARGRGLGREPAETADEFGARLEPHLGGDACRSLGKLTEAYARVRYGGAEMGADSTGAAARTVIASLEAGP